MSRRLGVLLLGVVAWAGSMGCATAPTSTWSAALPPGLGLVDTAQDEQTLGETSVNVPLWPLFEWTELADGSSEVTALLLYASRRNADGELESIRVVNYLQGPGYTVFFPFYYDIGEGDGADRGMVPLVFWGEGYSFLPLLLSAWWRAPDGTRSTWITPLYHATRDAEGVLQSRHMLLWFETQEGWLLFPLAFGGRGPEGGDVLGVLPFWLQGPGWWFTPPLLSGAWDLAGGGGSLWITPLYHHTRGPGGELSFHVLTYYQDARTRVLFPLAYVHRGELGTAWGLLPFYLQGPDGWAAPLILSGAFDGENGARTTWVTPLFHHTAREDAPDSFHLLTYFQGPGYRLLFPLAYDFGSGGARYQGVIPFWFGYPGGWLAPLLLSGGWSDAEGARTHWITPLFHLTRRDQGPDSFHVLTYFQGPGYQVLFPLAFRVGPEGREHLGVFPFWYGGPDAWVIPPLLSGRWSDARGETSTWITPLFHHTAREGAPDSFHALTYFQGPDYQVLFPLAYRFGAPGEEHEGIVPLYFGGPDWWASPLLLSLGWTGPEGHTTTWLTPLFHRTERGGGAPDSFHVLNYFQGPGYRVLFPLAYEMGPPGREARGVLPVYLEWPGSWFSPLLLSGRWLGSAGERTTLVTPLFHHTARGPGQDDSFHLLTYFQGPGYKVLFPLAYDIGGPCARWRGVLPLYLDGPDWFAIPPLLSAGWEAGDGSRSLWATPLYHHRHAVDGSLADRHLLNFVQVGDFTTLFPLYWDWTTARGDRRTLLAPLYWQSHYVDGDFVASVLPPLFNYRESATLNTSLLYQSIPFSFQDAGDDWELNLLWRLYHRRVQGELSTTVVGPLWYSETRPGLPMDYKLLGGLIARDVFETRGTYRDRYLWFFPGDEQPIEGAVRGSAPPWVAAAETSLR